MFDRRTRRLNKGVEQGGSNKGRQRSKKKQNEKKRKQNKTKRKQRSNKGGGRTRGQARELHARRPNPNPVPRTAPSAAYCTQTWQTAGPSGEQSLEGAARSLSSSDRRGHPGGSPARPPPPGRAPSPRLVGALPRRRTTASPRTSAAAIERDPADRGPEVPGALPPSCRLGGVPGPLPWSEGGGLTGGRGLASLRGGRGLV